MSAVCGVILAGGQSRRMGQPKQTLRWPTPAGDITWLDHARHRLLQVCSEVCVSGPDGQPDLLPDQPGPLAGMATIMTASPGERCLFLPVDMPRVPVEHLGALLQTSTAHAAYRNSLFPLLLTGNPDCLALLQARLESQDPAHRSVRGLLQDLGADVTWLQGDAQALSNANTPDDLRQIIPAESEQNETPS
ncbi:MAG: molybdenum cofactor guanylyltransferase [Natronospirillum sp.]|uniref:molybdenum cofactor guanylyltransferase n=1 Tax=Natronospirillum sp. TaxID=2812955 RepID=UPI0025FFEA59|nr:molybdenum cofactor guanylyltransferase [Natronospirillum sp.]MCH8551086.1 molybdenum cofactor guanylyltransferase [Natronospirillum sp.]